jgi:transcriptional regulator with XRE-family HTH domain
MKSKTVSPSNLNRLKYLGTFLRELRINQGLRQADVSASVNLSRNSISRIENFHNFSVIHLFELADTLDINLNELFQDIE